VYVLRQNCRAAGWRWDTKCVSVFYDSIRYVAIDDVSYREKRILWETKGVSSNAQWKQYKILVLEKHFKLKKTSAKKHYTYLVCETFCSA
jgi:hypothetical protein